MYWKPSPQVVISSGSGGTPIDFVSQFSIEDKRFREFRVVLKAAPKHKLRYSTVPIKYSGSATLNQTITFQGQTFNCRRTGDGGVEVDPDALRLRVGSRSRPAWDLRDSS